MIFNWSTVVDCELRWVSITSAPEVTVTVSLRPSDSVIPSSDCAPTVSTTFLCSSVTNPGADTVTVYPPGGSSSTR
jgi:hypothetical protein